MASTNTSAATATVISGWSTTVQNFSDLGAPPYDLWFTYTPVANERALGIWAKATSPNYTRTLRVMTGPITALDVIRTIGNEPAMVPTTPGEALYFKVSISGSSTPTVPLSMVLVQSPTGVAPSGSILINDVSDPIPAAILSPTGEILGFLPAAAGEGGAVLPDCTIALEDEPNNDIKIYDSQLQQIATAAIDLDTSGQISTNLKDKFYAGVSAGATTTVWRFGKTGAIDATWTLSGSGSLYGLAPSRDESILYYTKSTGGTLARPVQRWDLLNDVALPDLVAGIVGTIIRRDVLVMADDSILVPYWPFPAAVYILRYNAAGVVLNTYTTGAAGAGYDHMLLDPLDSGVFLLAEQTLTTRYFTRIQATTGAVVGTFNTPVAIDGRATNGTSFFGASFSCPVLILKCPVTIPPTVPQRVPPTTTPTCPCPAATPPAGTTTTTTGPPTSSGTPPSTTPPGVTPVTPARPIVVTVPPTTWTPFVLCPGGGTVNSYPLANAGESMDGCREDRVWVEAAFQTFDEENATATTAEVWAVDQTIPAVPMFSSTTNSRARASGRAFGLGKITRGMSDDNGNYAGVSFSVKLDDKDRAALRTRLGDEAQRYVWDREIRAFIGSETNRRTGWSTPPRELARCLTKDIALDRGFTGSIQCEDRLISQFGAFGPDRSFSSRLLTKGLLQGIPEGIVGKPQQWILGEVSDEGATDPVTGALVAKGLVPLWCVGSLGAEDEYHLCAHDICGMLLYGSDGGVDGAPPKRVLLTDWRWETVDLTDADTGLVHRMTQVYLPTGSVASEAHKNGTLTIAANVGGVLGANGLMITDLFSIYQYVFEHLVLPEQESLTGEYVGSPQWADGRYMLDSTSFAAAQAFSAARVGGLGYQGGFVLGGPGQGAVPLRELLRRMSNSGDCWFTWTAGGQLRVKVLDDAAAVADSQLLTEPADLRALPTPTFGREEVENPVLFAYDYDDDKQRFRVAQESVEEERARKRMGQPKPSPSPIAMRCTRDPATARDVAQRRLLRRKYPPAYYPVVEPLVGLDRDPGDVIRITSIEGVGAGSTQRALWIRETSYDQATRRVTHLCRDLTDIIGTAAFAAGDDVPTYVLGTAEQQAHYVFAGDDDGLVTAGGGGRVVAKGAR